MNGQDETPLLRYVAHRLGNACAREETNAGNCYRMRWVLFEHLSQRFSDMLSSGDGIVTPLCLHDRSLAVLVLKCAWEKLAWPSKKNLLSEFIDMLRRIAQLASWSEDLVTPQCVWLPGLFNPTAYLTAVMQVQLVTLSTPQGLGEQHHCRCVSLSRKQ